MAITKYESYYNQIKENLIIIKDDYGYNNLSQAFIFWYLKNYKNFTEQQIEEALIDGGNDNGIDAIILDEDSQELTVMQFKFPNVINNINKEISQADILKTLNGFNTLISHNDGDVKCNDKFLEFKGQLQNMLIMKFNLYFIGFNNGVIDNKGYVENFAADFKNKTGSDMQIKYHDKSVIANIYEKINRKNSISVNLKYKQMQQAYDINDRNINSYVGVVNGVDLINSIDNKIVTIFDENIRLYEKKSTVNDSIKDTASSREKSSMFYFYNNGIVFICDKARHSPNSLTITLEGASIVNGCQTVTSLFELNQKGLLKTEVDILTRVIEISDYNERMEITEYLNSQTPIKDSYFISNHTIVRELQKELLEYGYFLERQINEYEYKKQYGEMIAPVKTIISLENAIQYYTGYWLNKHAAVAKRGKGALFDKNKVEELLSKIEANKVLESHKIYLKVSNVLTKYRKTRRNVIKTDFADYLGFSQKKFLDNMNDFLYVNTGDILILNTVKNLKDRYILLNITFNDDKLIIDSIFIIKDILKQRGNSNPSSMTKNSKVFSEVQAYINKIDKEYVCSI